MTPTAFTFCILVKTTYQFTYKLQQADGWKG